MHACSIRPTTEAATCPHTAGVKRSEVPRSRRDHARDHAEITPEITPEIRRDPTFLIWQVSIDIWALPSEVEPNGSSWYVVIDPGEIAPRSRRDRAEIAPRSPQAHSTRR